MICATCGQPTRSGRFCTSCGAPTDASQGSTSTEFPADLEVGPTPGADGTAWAIETPESALPTRDRGASRRSAVPIVLAVLAGGALIAGAVLWTGRSSDNATSTPPTTAERSPTTTKKEGKEAAIAAAAQAKEDAELKTVVGRLDALMVQSAQGRQEVIATVNGVQNCSINAYDASVRMQNVIIPNRENVLRGVDDLQVTNPTASTLKDLFRKALSNSIDSNRYYLLWMRDVYSDYRACRYTTTAPTSANLVDASRISGAATAAKIAFVEAYNPIAARFPGYKNDWTETDF